LRGFLILLTLISIFCVVVYDSVVAVPDGYVGVTTCRLRRFGPIATAPRTLDPGLHLSLPLLTRLSLYNTRIQMLVLQVPVGEGKIVQMTGQVRIEPDSAVILHQKRGPNYLAEVRPWLTEIFKGKISEAHGRLGSPEIRQDILDTVEQALAADGIAFDRPPFLTLLEHLSLNLDPPTEEESDTDEDAD